MNVWKIDFFFFTAVPALIVMDWSASTTWICADSASGSTPKILVSRSLIKNTPCLIKEIKLLDKTQKLLLDCLETSKIVMCLVFKWKCKVVKVYLASLLAESFLWSIIWIFYQHSISRPLFYNHISKNQKSFQKVAFEFIAACDFTNFLQTSV